MTAYNTPDLPKDSAFYERSTHDGMTVPLDDKDAQNATSQYKELPIEFEGRGEVRGFRFRQILKSDKGYVYEVRQPELPPHYEVFRRVENPRFKCVSYPGSNSFGVWASTAKSLTDAFKRFDSL